MRIAFEGIWVLAVFALMLTACGGGGSSGGGDTGTDDPPVVTGGWYRPEPLATWQWQLTGSINTAYDVEVYDVDLFDTPQSLIEQLQAGGKKVVCYFSAGTYEEWREDAGLFPEAVLGRAVAGWPGERWLDIRSADVHAIMTSRLDLARQKGCDGVEPDNVDGYGNSSGFALQAADQLSFNRLLANEAHGRDLSVGLKNDLEQIGELVDYFDFAVNEQCFAYAECDLLAPFIAAGKAVFHTEYDQEYVDNPEARGQLCSESLARQFSTLILPMNLDDTYRFSCF